MKTTFPAITVPRRRTALTPRLRPPLPADGRGPEARELRRTPVPRAIDVREEILARSRAGADLAEIDRALIQPAAIDEDEKAALWLLAWCSQREGGPTWRR